MRPRYSKQPQRHDEEKTDVLEPSPAVSCRDRNWWFSWRNLLALGEEFGDGMAVVGEGDGAVAGVEFFGRIDP